MVASIASSPAIDLSALPPPVLVAQPGFEVVLAGKVAQALLLSPELTTLLTGIESEPARKLLEADAYDEIVLAQACNDAAKGLLLAFAKGANLDQLGALYDAPRLEVIPPNLLTGEPAVLESDTAYRQRLQLAPHAFSVAGPELAYVYHARSAHGDVADVTATSPNPGEVVIAVLSSGATGVPAAPVLAAVTAALGDEVRPLTDEVTVVAAAPVDFTIAADLFVFAGPDSELIRTTALASLDAFLASARRLGRDVPRSALIAALHTGNVQRVVLNSPVADLVIAPTQFARVGAITVDVAGAEF